MKGSKMEWHVLPDGSAEEHGILRHDGQSGPKSLQWYFGDIDVVHKKSPGANLRHTE